jgi:hypothetical protein
VKGGNAVEAVAGAPGKLKMNFEEDVDHHENRKVIDQVVRVVWNSQQVSFEIPGSTLLTVYQEPSTCTLTFKNIAYSREDLGSFAKTKYRSWRKKFKEATDEEHAKRKRRHERNARLVMRQRQVC